MPNDPFHSAEWLRSLTLSERISSLRKARSAAEIPFDRARAERRLARWKSQAPFQDAQVFVRRLAVDGTSEPELLRLLGEPSSALRERSAAMPSWLSALASAFAEGRSERPREPNTALRSEASFLSLVGPLIDGAIQRLQEEVSALASARPPRAFDPASALSLCAAQLPESLAPVLSRTLVLELNVARVEGRLEGTTPQDRFRSYTERLRDPDVALALLEEYPLLGRQVVNALERWIAVSSEFLRRLDEDWEAICRDLALGSDPGPLSGLEGAGDTHRGGRRVLLATFASGFRLVYKPKSLAVDLHFQELLAWLNERGATPSFRTLHLLDRRTYGWVEHVGTVGCTSTAEVERFYARLGGYLALFYALEATDFHAENILASGEHPMPIDLEALFHPRLKSSGQPKLDLAYQALAHSVTRVGILPERVWASADSPGVDLSGMGNPEGQLTPFNVPQWKDHATDTMQLVRERVPMLGAKNQPTLDGAGVDLLQYAEPFEAGFSRTYELLLRHREDLLAEKGPVAAFSSDEVRVILRMTQTYASLLRESFHPDALRDALERDRLLDRLWMHVGVGPHLEAVIPAEREDLLRGDIPMFVTRPEARDLWTSLDVRLPEFFSESGLALARGRIGRLSAADLARQLWIIGASLSTVATGVAPVASRPGAPQNTPPRFGRERLLEAARAIGDRLEALAIREKGEATWLGLDLLDEQHASVVPLGVDLYDGLPGVALFLAYLGWVTGAERYSALAREALVTLRAQLKQMKGRLPMIGGFCGWGGIIYALTHLGGLWQEPELTDEAERVVDLLPDLIGRDEELDVISGSAGCIVALLNLHRQRPSSKTMASAILCGERLCGRAEPMPDHAGRAVRTSGAKRPLAGFSHGAAGMAWSLLHLAGATHDARFREAALEMIRYERCLFSAEASNWLDLRDWVVEKRRPGDPDPCQSFWCHGAPGIGLARLDALGQVDDPEIRAEIATALRTTVSSGFGYNHSLCHGDLGNIELFLQARRLGGGSAWDEESQRIAGSVLASIERDGWRCGNPRSVESPGLLTGLAGIGYGLLRLAESQRVPPVLLLSPGAGEVGAQNGPFRTA